MHFSRTHGSPVGPALGKADNPPVLKGRCQRMAPSARISMLAQDAEASYPEAGYTVAADPKSRDEHGASMNLKASSSRISEVL